MGEVGKHHTVLENKLNEFDPAIVYLSDEYLDNETISQVKNMMESSSNLSHVRVMPDCHVGQGCCVGFTCVVCRDSLVPSYVGGDIGCGILTYPLNTKKLNLVKIEKIIKKTIPMGNGHTHVHEIAPIEESFISRYLEKAQIEANQYNAKFNNNDETNWSDIAAIHTAPTFNYGYFTSLCDKIGINVDVCVRSFGTLGGGNHFIEINQDNDSKEYYLTIHSGSRSFGIKLFEYYNSLIPANEKCLSPENSVSYVYDMIVAQQLAIMNRHIMLLLILRAIDIDYFEEKKMESIHNYIDFNRMILRKGAISAEKDEFCIVALNMKDGILICQGKGNEDWNYSCAHGCGRFFSRSQAKRNIKLKDYKHIMRDVVSTSICIETIDEAPQAYKDTSIVMEALGGTVTIVRQLVSVVSLKGTG